jgi:predicted ATP-dependent endonuclease of OLD family
VKVRKFRIQDYKSIVDTRDCWLASDLTILAGKNESGKSAILEALRDFDARGSIDPEANRIGSEDRPLISVTFSITAEELNELLLGHQLELPDAIVEHFTTEGIELFKDADGDYLFTPAIHTLFEVSGTEELEEQALTLIREEMPFFVFFDSFVDVLPFETDLASAPGIPSVTDFATVAGLDLAAVSAAPSTQVRKNLLAKHSALVSGNFKQQWQQDEVQLAAESEGSNIVFGVREVSGTDLFRVDQRSKGFQWFLSFYLRLQAQGDEDSVILIDEPGLYLHATAQADVLEVLESIAKRRQIIFSTHSPYLLDPARFDRIRLVIKEPAAGTRIENKVHRGADTETLTPIRTAIGLDVSGEFSVAHERNALLEGISDYYYLRAMQMLLDAEDPDLYFIPCVGAHAIPQLASLLIGWDLRFVAVLDADSAGKGVATRLKNRISVADEQIVFVSEEANQSIEDLFTIDDFNEHVLREVPERDQPNSRYIKNQGIDEILLARQFFERVSADPTSVDVSPETKASFGALLAKVDAGFPARAGSD